MKIQINEQQNCFEIMIEPENMQEANRLVRLGMQTTKKLINLSTSAFSDGSFHTYIAIGRYGNAPSDIPKVR